MNKLFVLLIFVFSYSQTLKADLGSCLVYEAKFYLKDGSFFNGHIEVAGYGEMSYLDENGSNKYCSDTGMMALIKDLQGNQNILLSRDGGSQNIQDFDKLTVYKGIEEISPNPLKLNRRPYWSRNTLGFIDKDDIIFLDSTEVDKIIFWNARYAKRNWIYYELIPAPKSMVETVRTQQYWNNLSIAKNPDTHILEYSEEFLEWGIEMINYNPKVNTIELKRLANLKLKALFDWDKIESKLAKQYDVDSKEYPNNGRSRLLSEYREKHFQEIREWFWEKKILIVQVWGSC